MIDEKKLIEDFEKCTFTDENQKKQYRDLLNYLIDSQSKRRTIKKPKLTNADRIRNMTDEELAELFYTENYLAIKTNTSETKEDILEWLQTEVEDGAE